MYSKKYYMSAKEEYLHSKRLFHYNDDKLSFPRLGELTSKKIYILFKEALMPE